MIDKHLGQLAVGDTIVDTQGGRHTIAAMLAVEDDGDNGLQLTMVTGEVREVFPVGAWSSVWFRVEAAS